jgi:peroxiredoxin
VIEGLDAVVVAVSTDDLTGAEYAVKEFGAQYPIAYTSRDPSIPQKYGVFNLHGDGLASASTFIIGKDGQLKWKHISSRYPDHAPASVVIAKLKEVAS